MNNYDEYYHDFEKLIDDFHETLHEYPIFSEQINEIYDNDIKEIDELVNKNDLYYLKKAINKLNNVIDYIKDTNYKINKLYSEFDKKVIKWSELELKQKDDKLLDKLNDNINKVNILIKSHDLKDIEEANKLLDENIKLIKG